MFKPKTLDELKSLVNNLEISLKEIDVSEITDMSLLFCCSERVDFDGINEWDTSKVTDMVLCFHIQTLTYL